MDTQPKVIKDKKISPESLIARIEKLSLEEKINLAKAIKKSISEDQIKLEKQLELIKSNGQSG